MSPKALMRRFESGPRHHVYECISKDVQNYSWSNRQRQGRNFFHRAGA